MQEHTITTYNFEELDEQAQERAVDAMREKFAQWWDTDDNDSLGEIMVYAFAEAIGSPEVGRGEANIKLPRLALEGWDLGRGEDFDIRGVLDRDNAPGLPWTDNIDEVLLRHRDYDPWIYVVEHEETPTLDDHDNMVEAVEEAHHAALKAGRDELDYRNSDEYVREMIQANQYQFTEDGKYYA